MAHVYGKNYSRAELLSRVGDISQIARIKPYRLIEGLEDGVFALDVATGSGLDFTVLASRGLDISAANFHGRSLPGAPLQRTHTPPILTTKAKTDEAGCVASTAVLS